jgi:2-polyprenyl-3-methyl-5-hydroxy-6-metoxy-1,4-benzoquinol methylase
MTTANCAPYTAFAYYYDMLGWSEFSDLIYPYVLKFIKEQDQPPKNFLDLACGTGVLAHKLAERKIKVTGIDISPQMIEVASGKISPNGCPPKFILGNITNFKLDRQFDMAGCFFDSINHLKSKTEVKKTFIQAVKHLRRGAWFLFDMVTKTGLENWEDYYSSSKDSYYVVQEARLSPNKAYATVKIEAFINDGNNGTVHVKEVFNEIHLPLSLVYEYLTEAGFSRIIVKPFPPADNVETAERLMFYAKK